VNILNNATSTHRRLKVILCQKKDCTGSLQPMRNAKKKDDGNKCTYDESSSPVRRVAAYKFRKQIKIISHEIT